MVGNSPAIRTAGKRHYCQSLQDTSMYNELQDNKTRQFHRRKQYHFFCGVSLDLQCGKSDWNLDN